MTDREAYEYLEPITKHPTMTGEYCRCLKMAVSALHERIEREDGWISVEDRLPEHEEGSPHYGLCSPAVLVAYGVRDKRIFIAEHRIDRWIDFHSNEIISRQELVTHWMPLPEPPKEVNNGQHA